MDEITFDDFPIMNKTTEDAYSYCNSCVAEYFGEDVGRIPYSRTTANGDWGLCLFCKEEMSLDLEEEL